MNCQKNLRLSIIIVLISLTLACGQEKKPTPTLETPTSTLAPSRESLIPLNPGKISPGEDIYPPKSETTEYEDPLPLPYPVNTAGGEDSAFVMPDGNTLYVWFTPDVSKSAEEQLPDGVTGIYVFHKIDEGWSTAERVMLQDPGKLALDGCEFIQNNMIWFCSAREGYAEINWFTAEFKDGEWQNWQLVDFNAEYEVGELHITADGQELYFHSSRPGGKGGYDIWDSAIVDGIWQEPVNVEVVNSLYIDGWPFITEDGSELWFTRGPGAPALYRSKKVNGEWSEPEKMFSNFASEASLDRAGNVYFTHHYFKDDVMLEADIYMARRKD